MFCESCFWSCLRSTSSRVGEDNYINADEMERFKRGSFGQVHSHYGIHGVWIDKDYPHS